METRRRRAVSENGKFSLNAFQCDNETLCGDE